VSRIVEPSSQDQQKQQQVTEATAQTPHRSKMVQRLLDASNNLQTFLKDLLTTQAVLVAGTEACAFLVERQEEKVGLRLISHVRPDESDAETRQAAIRAFQNIVRPCVEQGKDGAIEVGAPDDGDAQYCLVTILRNEGAVVAVSAVITRCRDMDRAKQRLTSMQLVAGYFELFSLRRYTEQARAMAERHQHVLQFTGAVQTSEGFNSAAMSLCNELATRTGATRVSLGWVKGKQIKVKALSHTEKFDKKQELIVQLQKVMEECMDQEEPVRFDPEGNSSGNVTRAARELSVAQGGNVVFSVPLRRRDEIVGVLTVEFPPRTKLDEQTESAIAVGADLLAPQLADRYDNDRNIFVKVGKSIAHGTKLAIGPKHMGVKLLVAGLIGLIAFVTLYKPMYRVRAPFQLVAKERRSISAPDNGILKQVFFKPGHAAKKGDTLAQMDTRELELQLQEYEAQVKTWQAKADNFLGAATADAGRDTSAEYVIALRERDVAQVQADFLKHKIELATIRAPFDCIVLRGELSDRQNAPVQKGDVLFEIAESDPQNPNRIAVQGELHVPDRDIQEVKRIIDQQKAGLLTRDHDGEIATTSFPSEGFNFKIDRIVPMGEPREGENAFNVYAAIDNPPSWMFPGESGEARVNIENRRLVWIWTHRLVDWVKLKLWI
jgi:multidrug efflux pump subunit AcrA (membrane-fusion protein)